LKFLKLERKDLILKWLLIFWCNMYDHYFMSMTYKIICEIWIRIFISSTILRVIDRAKSISLKLAKSLRFASSIKRNWVNAVNSLKKVCTHVYSIMSCSSLEIPIDFLSPQILDLVDYPRFLSCSQRKLS